MASLRLSAKLSEIASVHSFVAQIGRSQDLDERSLYTLHLVLEEACTNVIEHAYQGQGGPMEISLEMLEDRVRVIVRDWGVPFEPDEVPIPDVIAPLEDRPLGGLGVYLLREMMDDVCYQFSSEDGNTLTMIKQIPDHHDPANQNPSAANP